MAGGRNDGGAMWRVGVIAAIMLVGGVMWVMNRSEGDLAPARVEAEMGELVPTAPSSGDHVSPLTGTTQTDKTDARSAKPAPITPPPIKPAPVASTSGEVRVGAWNIEWFGKPENRSGAGRDVAQDPNDLADAIIQSKVAVLGIAEIVTRIPGRPIRSREVEAVIDAIKRKTGAAWQYVLYPGRSDGDQLTGVLWNPDVVSAKTAKGGDWSSAESTPWSLPIPKQRTSQGSYVWNRPPHAMKFSTGDGKTDFVVVMLHMKADYQGDFAVHRKAEADALVKALPELRGMFKDSDIILTGDTNCTAENEAALRAFVDAGFTDLNTHAKQTHWRGGFMDRTLVPSDQPEFKNSSFTVGSDSYLKARGLSPQEYKQRYSDHYLIWASVKVMPDDD